MSITSDELSIIALFAKIRRQLNLKATQALKPLGIGPKQAVVLREIRSLKSLSPIELARQTQTDPTSTGKILESLIKRNWVKRTDNPRGRRSWRVSLTRQGSKAVQKIDGIWEVIAKDFCGPLSERERESLFKLFLKISTDLDYLHKSQKDIP